MEPEHRTTPKEAEMNRRAALAHLVGASTAALIAATRSFAQEGQPLRVRVVSEFSLEPREEPKEAQLPIIAVPTQLVFPAVLKGSVFDLTNLFLPAPDSKKFEDRGTFIEVIAGLDMGGAIRGDPGWIFVAPGLDPYHDATQAVVEAGQMFAWRNPRF